MEPASKVSLNGTLVDADTASVSVFDHGLTVGDGVFETLKVIDGTPFALTRHLRRLRRSAEGLGLELGVGDEDLVDAVTTTLDANNTRDGRLRITATAGVAPLGSGRGESTATILVAVGALEPTPTSTKVVTVPWRRNEHGATAGLKTTSYAENVVALARAHRSGASEALLANTAGKLCEGTGSNVFVVIDGTVCTPALESGCLAGITRELVLEVVDDIVEADLGFDCLDVAEEVFLTSSTREVQPVEQVDRRLLDPCPGPHTARVARAFANLVAAELDP
jgi:branched-chain amino acid aminotransferase